MSENYANLQNHF